MSYQTRSVEEAITTVDSPIITEPKGQYSRLTTLAANCWVHFSERPAQSSAVGAAPRLGGEKHLLTDDEGEG